MIRLLIFDLDGTLVDSAPDIVASANALLANRGRSPLSRAEVLAGVGHGPLGLVGQLFPEARTDAALAAELSSAFGEIYCARLLGPTYLMPGVGEFLAATDRRLAIVTNKIEAHTRLTFAGSPLTRHKWERILSGDSLPKRKPDPLPLHECLRASAVDVSEAVMIGDGLPDVEAARAAGMVSIALANGYTPREKLAAAKPNVMIDSCDELAAALARLDAGL